MQQIIKPELSGIITNTNYRKHELLNKLITRILEERVIKPESKVFFFRSSFLDNNYALFQNVLKRFEDDNIPTFEYMREKYKFEPNYTDMSQYDISELLKELLIKEELTLNFIKNINDFKMSNLTQFKQFLSYCDDIVVEMENVSMCSFADLSLTQKVLSEIKDNSDIVTFETLEPFNRLEFRSKQLCGILAGSGLGKSLMMEKLHADSPNDIVLHFSLELPQKLFLRRIITQLGIVSDNEIEYLSDSQVYKLAQIIKQKFPRWHYTCVDTETSIINVDKVEKMIKYYKSVYSKEIANGVRFKVFLDYVQYMDEVFDPLNCRVADNLHRVASKNDVCIIAGLQANDNSTLYNKPAESSMIALVRSLKNGFDIIQSFHTSHVEGANNISIMQSQTKKHRNGKFCNFVYEIDHNKAKDNWELKTKLSDKQKANPKINLIEGSHEDYPEEDIFM